MIEGRNTMEDHSNEAQIRALIENWAKAVRDVNMGDILAHHTADIVMFDVPPPLQYQGMAEYEKTWEIFFKFSPGGDGSFDILELHISASDSVAFAYGLVQVVDNPVRLSMGFRKEKGQWLIAHEHHSYPMEIKAEA
jgi:ketosteroid isomerase-like protein